MECSILHGDAAHQVLGPTAARKNPLAPVLEQSAVRVATRRIRGTRTSVALYHTVHKTLLQLFRELRRSETRVERARSQMAKATLEAFETPSVSSTTRKTRGRGLRSATVAPQVLIELGALLGVLPQHFDPADVHVVAAAAR